MLVRITVDFSGYPDPDGTRVEYRAGSEVDLAEDYASLIIAKGLAEKVKAPRKPKSEAAE